MWLFYGLAMVTMIFRISFILRRRRTLQLDDWSLLFSATTITTATAILYHFLPTVFLADEAVFNYGSFRKNGLKKASYTRLVDTMRVVEFSFFILSFTTIYSVKLGFLFFFRCLVDRITLFERMWKGTLVSIILAFLLSMIAFPLSWHACEIPGLLS